MEDSLFDILTGKSYEHLVQVPRESLRVHRHLLQDYLAMQEEAQKEGIKLRILSGHRDHARQTLIWNEKARGQRVLYDDQGKKMDYSLLSDEEKVYAILRWSALPGVSRHHWGTEIDVYDADRVNSPQEVRLVPQEIAPGGVFEHLGKWLVHYLSRPTCPFFRPYAEDQGGIAPEWWHLSYKETAAQYYQKYTLKVFLKNLQESEIDFKELILADAESFYERFFTRIAK